MPALAHADAERLSKLLGLLGSDHAGERDAAGLMAHRLVKDRGLTWFDIIIPQPPPPRQEPQRKPKSQPSTPPRQEKPSGTHRRWAVSWREACRIAHEHPGDLLTPWEAAFVSQLCGWHGRPTDRQLAVLRGIVAKIGLKVA